VDLDAGVLSVRQSLSEVNYRITFTDPKTTKSRRQVSLDAFTVKALRAHRTLMQRERLALGIPASAVEHDLVFTRPDGSPTRGRPVAWCR
jgi:integrase